jgi:hypothetical protein
MSYSSGKRRGREELREFLNDKFKDVYSSVKNIEKYSYDSDVSDFLNKINEFNELIKNVDDKDIYEHFDKKYHYSENFRLFWLSYGFDIFLFLIIVFSVWFSYILFFR